MSKKKESCGEGCTCDSLKGENYLVLYCKCKQPFYVVGVDGCMMIACTNCEKIADPEQLGKSLDKGTSCTECDEEKSLVL